MVIERMMAAGGAKPVREVRTDPARLVAMRDISNFVTTIAVVSEENWVFSSEASGHRRSHADQL